MATIMNDAAYMGFPLSIKRGNPAPVDTTAVWYNKTELETYAASGATAYVGQILTLYTDGKAEAYMIANEAGNHVKLAQTTASGDLASDVATLQGQVSSLIAKVGAAAEGETAATGLYALIEEVKTLANTKVASVGATVVSVVVDIFSATAPKIQVQISKVENNALALAEDGLKVIVPDVTHPEYTIKKLETATAGMSASYQLTKDGTGAAEAKKVKDAVVNSIAATANKGIEIAGSAIAPTIGVKVDPDASNALTVGAAGLKVEIPAAAEYSIVKDKTSTYAATYHLTKGGVNTGVAIDIPKDMVVKSGEVVTNPAGQTAGTYLVLTLANATEDKVYINVGSLIEYVTSGSKNGDQIKINVSSDHKVTATLSNGSVTKAQLVTEVQTSLGKADSALQKSSITTGTTNGTIRVSGDDIKVKGLGSAAYTNADAYDEKGAASAVLGTAADGAGTATVYGVKAAIAATNTEVAKKINATEVSAIGKSGNVKDLLQTEGDVLVFNCGTASTVI